MCLAHGIQSRQVVFAAAFEIRILHSDFARSFCGRKCLIFFLEYARLLKIVGHNFLIKVCYGICKYERSG